MTAVYFGLGSNIANDLGTPLWHLQNAVHALAGLHPTKEIQVSSLYTSLPMGPSDQPDYFNAVACVHFDEHMLKSYSPEKLLAFTQSIEKSGQRDKKRHWGERSIDVDILLYGDTLVHSTHLTIPHIGILERNFVCVPLCELNPLLLIQKKIITEFAISKNMTGLVLHSQNWV